ATTRSATAPTTATRGSNGITSVPRPPARPPDLGAGRLFPHTLHRRRITMATVAITRVVLPAVIAAFFASALVLPALRHRLRTRSWGVVVHREGDPYQRVLGVAMALFLAGVVLWTVLYELLDPALLGVWPAPAWLAWAGAALAAAGIGVTALAQA